MGNNPADPQTEVYKLLFSNPTKIPAPASAPVAVEPAHPTTTGNPLVNLVGSSHALVLAKWGQDSAVYYIGDLIHGQEIRLIQPDWAQMNIPKAKGGGLSGYTLFNETSLPTPPVPDCGVTACLLSFALCGIGLFGRRNR